MENGPTRSTPPHQGAKQLSDNRPETRTRARFWAEVRRRRVFRVGGLYVAGAFVILQLGEIVLPAFNAPDWALQTLVVFVFLGLPVALALSWVFDLTPEGLKRTRSLVPVGSASMMPWVALLIVTTVSLGLGAVWFSRSAMSGSDAAGPRERTRPTAARFASLEPDAPISAIAVLPLAHFAEGDDLFARQLHDEIIIRLSELTSLRVVSRTSVERYRTTDKLLPEIAAELNVQAVVTGSVAMTGESDSVRISIQLLHAPSDTHLESRTFEREMKDVLRLQTEVAMAIAATVQEEVGAEVDDGAQQVAEVDPEAYVAFVRGQSELEHGTPEGLEAALGYFDQAVEHDSTYAAAWVWRAGTRLAIESEGGRPSPEVLARARADAEHANDLGGAEDEAAAVMFAIRDYLPRPGGAGEPGGVATDAAGVQDSEPDSLQRRYLTESTRFGRRFSQPSPLREAYRLVEAGQYDSAAVAFTEIVKENPSADRAWATLEELHLQQGDFGAAVGVRQDRIYAIQGRTPAAQAEVRALRVTFSEDDPATYWQWRYDHNTNRQTRGERVSEVEWATTAVGLGDHGLALRHLEAAIENRDPGLLSLRTSARWDPLRNDPAFQDLSRRARDLWQGGGGTGGRRPERAGERRPR